MAKDRSNLYYLGVGCLIVGILLATGLAVFVFFAYRWSQGVEEAMKDPEVRRQRVLEILVADELPDGYHAMVGLTVPYFLDIAILTNEDPHEQEELPDLGERGLIYVAFRDLGRDRQELERFFAGELSDPEVLERHNIDLDLRERIHRGVVEHPIGAIPWVSHRGEIHAVQTGGRHRGLTTLFSVDCGGDYDRVGIWFGPDVASGDGSRDTVDGPPSAAARWVGTVADADAVGDFLSHFRFCPP
ncbi:MAG: hypothetical protein R3244_11760 [Thermoanaerobaculia bacterium]|nr:hypothetical protein [Thermoanaerobaculia bacterium]